MEKQQIENQKKTNNIIDYIAWRGDIPFSVSPFNEVDAVIFNQLTYLKIDGLVSDNIKDKISLAALSESFMNSEDYAERSNNGPFINNDTVKVLQAVGKTLRFGNTKLCFFKSDINVEQEKQFAAYTAFLDDKTVYVAFRGTHDEIVGWKEDFNMAFESPVPSQTEAVKYLEEVASSCHNDIRVGGHSKGGNLAIYACAFCSEKLKKRILAIYNNDGPGFEQKILQNSDFFQIVPKIQLYFPESSMVGVFFEHAGHLSIVKSSNENVFQHDLMSWQVMGTSFVKLDDFSKTSKMFKKTMSSWLEQMSTQYRKEFVATLFGLFDAAEATTLTEFSENWLRNSPKIAKYLMSIDKDTRNDLSKMINMLIRASKVAAYEER